MVSSGLRCAKHHVLIDTMTHKPGSGVPGGVSLYAVYWVIMISYMHSKYGEVRR